MSTTNAIAVRGSYAQRMLATAHGLLEASLIAWRTRREHRNAIAQLRTMSDAELRDVGIEVRDGAAQVERIRCRGARHRALPGIQPADEQHDPRISRGPVDEPVVLVHRALRPSRRLDFA